MALGWFNSLPCFCIEFVPYDYHSEISLTDMFASFVFLIHFIGLRMLLSDILIANFLPAIPWEANNYGNS